MLCTDCNSKNGDATVEKKNEHQLCLMKEFFQGRLPLSFGLHPQKCVLQWWERTQEFTLFCTWLSIRIKGFVGCYLFSANLLLCVDIIIRSIKVDFMFGLPDCVCYVEEFVISSFVIWRFVISRFYSIHFTVTLAGT